MTHTIEQLEKKLAVATPGPWVYGPTKTEKVCHIIRAGNGFSVAFATPDLAGTQANARLIAAAPDLLAALEACIDAMTHFGIQGGNIGEASAAIAKAKGIEP